MGGVEAEWGTGLPVSEGGTGEMLGSAILAWSRFEVRGFS